MPTVKDKPLAPKEPGTRTLDRPPAPARPVTGEKPRRPQRYTRWIGWLIVLTIAVIAASVTTVVLMDDEPAANLGATLEQRLAKDAIEEQQQALIPAPAPVAEDLAAIRLDVMIHKDAIEELSADRSGAFAAPMPSSVALRLEQLLRKDAIEATNAAAFTDLGDQMRLLKEKIEDGFRL